MPVPDDLGGELELRAAVSCLVWVLGTELGSSVRASFLSQLSSPLPFLNQGLSYAQKPKPACTFYWVYLLRTYTVIYT